MPYYLDHAATTPLDPRVLEAMTPFFTDVFANPSSLHDLGIEVRKTINQAREHVASWFNVSPSGIIFTSGGTEATNLAIIGYAKAHPEKKHLITSTIEHHATTHTMDALVKEGYEVDFIPVDHQGFIRLDLLKKCIRKDTLLVSIIWGNNEIGTIQDVNEMGHIAHEYGALLHVDAVQMVGQTCINLDLLPIDMMSISAHKFYGPKGIGALITKDQVTLSPIIHGGNHEKGLRSGTEHVSGIIGLEKALELVRRSMVDYQQHLRTIYHAYKTQLETIFPKIIFNGSQDDKHSLPSILSISLPHVKSHELQFALNRRGVYVSTGSACLSNEMMESHVLKAIERDPHYGTIRLSFGILSTIDDIPIIVNIIKDVYDELKDDDQ